VSGASKYQKDSIHRNGYAYCSKECGKKALAQASSKTMANTNRKYSAKISARMKERNPMKNPETREKVSKALVLMGHKPKERLGNGKEMAIPQAVLMVALRKLSPVAEYSVLTKAKPGSGYPPNYKIDIAFPAVKMAIEVDGNSHCALIRQAQDKKKDDFLNLSGWTVLRVRNKQVMDRLSETVTFITSKLKEITTISQKVS
jgi:hypothetical protein